MRHSEQNHNLWPEEIIKMFKCGEREREDIREVGKLKWVEERDKICLFRGWSTDLKGAMVWDK